MDAIRGAKISLAADSLGGAGVHYWAPIAERYGLNLSVVNDAVDPIRTDEEWMIANTVCRVLGLGMASEKGHSDHATKIIFRPGPFSKGGVPP